VVSDPIPAGFTVESASGTGWTCDISGQTVTCTRADDLAVGPAPPITVTVVPKAGAEGRTVNTAVVAGTDDDANPANNTGVDAVTILGQADMSVKKVLTGDSIVSGATATWHITATDDGPSMATGVTVRDTLPAGLAYVSSSGTGWTCSAAAQVVTCTLAGDLAVGASSSVDITTMVTAAAGAVIVNTAAVAADQIDRDPSDNTASAPTVTVAAAPTSETSSPPGQSAQNAGLAFTGTESLSLVLLGLTCMLAGAGLLWLTRRRRRPA
jgi:large repetitive protein